MNTNPAAAERVSSALTFVAMLGAAIAALLPKLRAATRIPVARPILRRLVRMMTLL